MTKTEKVILKVLISPFSFLLVVYTFGLIWDFFNLNNYKSTNLFIVSDECDPNKKKPSILIIIALLILSIYISSLFVKLLSNKK
jgi:hypothetical protein